MTRRFLIVSLVSVVMTVAAGCGTDPVDEGLTFDEVGDELDEACFELRSGLRTSSVEETIELRRVQLDALSIVEDVPAADATDDELTIDADATILGALTVALSVFNREVSRLDVRDVDLGVGLRSPVDAWLDAVAEILDVRDRYALGTSRSILHDRLDTTSSEALDSMTSLGLTGCLTAELATRANAAAIAAFDRFVVLVAPSGDLGTDVAAACARYHLDVALDIVDARFDGTSPAAVPLVLRSNIDAALDRLLIDLGRYPLPGDGVDEVDAASFELREAIDSRTGSLVSDDVDLDPDDPIGAATSRLDDALAALAPGC